MLVATGSPGNWTILGCAQGAVGWATTAGETYSLLAIDDQFDDGGSGGTLRLTVDVAPPPPTIDVTTNPVGGFDPKTGEAAQLGLSLGARPHDWPE